jgi:hypothetical protein
MTLLPWVSYFARRIAGPPPGGELNRILALRAARETLGNRRYQIEDCLFPRIAKKNIPALRKSTQGMSEKVNPYGFGLPILDVHPSFVHLSAYSFALSLSLKVRTKAASPRL